MTTDNFRFGECEVRLASRELLRRGQTVELQPKAFDLLVYLVRNPGRIVTKDELLDQIWASRFVSESVIARTVMKARRAIGDDAENPRFILTQHGYGYRFMAQVEIEEGDEAEGQAPEIAPVLDAVIAPLPSGHIPLTSPRARRIWLPKRWWIYSAAIAVAIAIWLLWPREVNSTASPRLAVLPVANLTGDSDISWTELGLMTLIGDGVRSRTAIDLLPAEEVLAAVRLKPEAEPTPSQLLAWSAELNTQALVIGRLRRNGAEYELDLDLYRDGQRERLKTFAGDEPALLAMQGSAAVAKALSSQERGRQPLERISTDTYINETYARGLDAMAREHYRQAQELFRIVVKEEGQSAEARVNFSEALLLSGDAREARTQALQSIDVAAVRGDTALLARAYTTAADAELIFSSAKRAKPYALKALTLASDEFPEIQPIAQMRLANLARVSGENVDALHLINASIAAFQQIGSKYRLAAATQLKGLILETNDANAATVELQRALALARDVGRGGLEASILISLADQARQGGNCKAALGLIDEALRGARESGQKRQEVAAMITRGHCLNELGRTDEALEQASNAQVLAKETEQPRLLANVLMLRALILSQVDADEERAHLWSEAARLYEECGDLSAATGTNFNLAQRALDLRDYSAATVYRNKAISLAKQIDDATMIATGHVLGSIISYRKGDRREALAQVRQAHAISPEATRVWAESAASLAWQSLEQGKIEDAKEVLGSAAGQDQTYVSLCIAMARLTYEEGHYQAALKKQDGCLAQLGAQRTQEEDRSLRAAYARAAATGKPVDLRQARPGMIWL